jgi:hypothetical protein
VSDNHPAQQPIETDVNGYQTLPELRKPLVKARQIAGLKGYADAAIMPRSVGSLLVTLGCGAGSSA